MTRYNLLAAVASVAMLCSNSIFAQDTIALSIDNLFDLADQNSTKLRCLETDINVAQAAVDAAKAERLPDVSTSLSLSYLGNGNLWDRDFKNGSSIPMPHFGNNFALRASQAIYTGGGITSAINLAELEKKLAVLNRNESRSNVRFLLIGYYLQLLRLNNQEKVFCHNISLTEQVIDQMHARHNAGTALDNDITRYELQLENLKLQRTRITDTRKIINHRLITIVGLPASTTIVPDSAIAHTIPATLTESDWQHAAATNAVALQKALLNVDICRTKESLQHAELMPKISVIAEEHLDGPITIEVPTINKNFNYWYVGIGINYNISALFKSKKKLQQAKIESNKAKILTSLAKEDVENQVQAAFTEFLTSFTDLATQQKSVELELQNYDVVNNRYINELALITDMVDAANSRLAAELALVDSKINVVYNYYNMLFVSGQL